MASRAVTSSRRRTPWFLPGPTNARSLSSWVQNLRRRFSRLTRMTQTVRGVISRKRGEPVEVVDVVVPDPGPGEVVVDVIACGVCHTDLTYRDGGINDEFPFLLGHEAAGRVESVGPGDGGVDRRYFEPQHAR